MNPLFLHEQLYRGAEAFAKLGALAVTICGAGALGSLLADNLARQGVKQLTVIDDDRSEQHNVGTQLYTQSDIGAYKVEVLRAHIFRATGVEINAVRQRLDGRNAKKLLRGANVVIDTFDNSASRRVVTEFCAANALACLHIGMFEDYGEARWNETYRVPADVVAPNVCDYPLARNLTLLLVSGGSEALLRFALEGRQEDFSVTLRDLKITRETI